MNSEVLLLAITLGWLIELFLTDGEFITCLILQVYITVPIYFLLNLLMHIYK